VPARQEIRMGRAATTSEGLNWLTLSVIVLFHVGALAALFLFSWQRLVVMAVLYVLAINVGIGMCYHRLLTHRGYHVPKWLEYVMSICATTSLEGGPIFWVSTHRVHHQLSDQEGDPHTPREGGWWAHAGWILFGAALHAQTAVLALLARPEPRPFSCLAQQVSLASHYSLRPSALRWRLAVGRTRKRHCHGSVGRFIAGDPGPARYVACEFGNPPVG
jgi:fatty-acid desaturase